MQGKFNYESLMGHYLLPARLKTDDLHHFRYYCGLSNKICCSIKSNARIHLEYFVHFKNKDISQNWTVKNRALTTKTETISHINLFSSVFIMTKLRMYLHKEKCLFWKIKKKEIKEIIPIWISFEIIYQI